MLTPKRTLPWLLAVCLAGCSTARKTDVLEARLRSQEDTIAVYEAEMQRVKTELAAAHRQSEDLRLQLADDGRESSPAAESDAAFRATGIQLSSLMTGGLDTDGEPGHDSLSVVLIPHDGNGELVKLPGQIEIEALDPTQPGGTQMIGHWQFDQRDIHEHWHKGVVQSGYQFQLPWQTAPSADQVLILAHLTTADGRRFDTNLTVKVDPPGVSTDVAPPEQLQQASTPGVNPFDVRPAAGERPAQAKDQPADEIIWADGEGPASPGSNPSARQTRRTPPSASTLPADGPTTSPTSQRVPRPQPPAGTGLSAANSRTAQREVPPPIEDWFSDEDWATQEANSQTRGVRTSDSFTEQTLPQYR